MTALIELQQNSCRQVAILSGIYLLAFGSAMAWWLQWRGLTLTPVNLLGCFTPLLVCTAFAFTSTDDTEQYIMRIVAAGMFLPILILFWGGTPAPGETRTVWPGSVAFAVAHAASFVASVFYFGSSTTRVPASPDVTAVRVETLQARLQALATHGAPIRIAPGEANELVVYYAYPAGADRSHQARLLIRAENREVRVKERLSANAARPVDDHERSMRSPGDPAFDPTRPDATSVTNTVAQTTTIDPKKLAAVPVSLLGNSVDLPREYAAQLDGDGMITLLCAVVTRSGWNWQPVFFGE